MSSCTLGCRKKSTLPMEHAYTGCLCWFLQHLWVCEATVWYFKKFVCGHNITAHLARSTVFIPRHCLTFHCLLHVYRELVFHAFLIPGTEDIIYSHVTSSVMGNGDPLKWCHGKKGVPIFREYGDPHLKDITQIKQGSKNCRQHSINNKTARN